MKIALIGFGQMGQLIAKLAKKRNIEVVSIIDPNNKKYSDKIDETNIKKADVCIDFSVPEAIVSNIEILTAMEKNIVVGTTGWNDKMGYIRDIVTKKKTGLVYASNFSLGVNIFFKMIEYSSKLMDKIPDYDPYGLEMHHDKKVDSPSGTAKKLSSIVLSNIERKNKPQFNRINRKVEKDEFHFASIRAGNIPGIHKIAFDSAADTIELKHTARSREGFALGALKAANWLQNKSGFYNFHDIFEEILNEQN